MFKTSITPEKAGISSKRILDFFKRYDSYNAYTHSVIMARGDHIFAECYYAPFDKDFKHRMYSTSKSFVGVAIGLCEEDGLISLDDKLVDYPFDLLDELELAYAITVHKSQGSEYPVVIVPMYSCPPMLMSRNLLYTAVTRARKMVILVGRSDIPYKMAKNDREVLRYTTLKQRICDYY